MSKLKNQLKFNLSLLVESQDFKDMDLKITKGLYDKILPNFKITDNASLEEMNFLATLGVVLYSQDSTDYNCHILESAIKSGLDKIESKPRSKKFTLDKMMKLNLEARLLDIEFIKSFNQPISLIHAFNDHDKAVYNYTKNIFVENHSGVNSSSKTTMLNKLDKQFKTARRMHEVGSLAFYNFENIANSSELLYEQTNDIDYLKQKSAACSMVLQNMKLLRKPKTFKTSMANFNYADTQLLLYKETKQKFHLDKAKYHFTRSKEICEIHHPEINKHIGYTLLRLIDVEKELQAHYNEPSDEIGTLLSDANSYRSALGDKYNTKLDAVYSNISDIKITEQSS